MDVVELESEKRDYSISEFHDRFHKCLPKIVEINQGVCSDTGEETFGKGEVLIIAAISRQRRVVTKMQISNKPRLLSIPETYGEKLCVVNHGRPGKEDLLVNILSHHALPVTVCFPRNRVISVKERRVNTNSIPHMQLTEIFDEVFLLGHYINNGELCEGIVAVPLYLSQLRVSIVTCIKGTSVEKSKPFKRDLYRKCSLLSYDGDFGNPDIAEYDPSAVHTGKGMAYLEPTTYENIANLVQKNDPQEQFPDMTPEEVDALGLYEDVEFSNRPVRDQGIYYNQPGNRSPDTEIQHTSPHVKKSPSVASTFIHQLQSAMPRLKPLKTVANPPVKSESSPPAKTVSSLPVKSEPVPPAKTVSSLPVKSEPVPPARPSVKTFLSLPVKNASSPPVRMLSSSSVENQASPPVKTLSHRPQIAPKPIFNQIKPQDPLSDIQSEFSPPLPARQPSMYRETKGKQQVGIAHKYTNILPTTSVPPTRKREERPYTKHEERANTKHEDSQRTIKVVSSKEDVAKLTVNEVCDYLKLLNLSQYEEKFKHHMIDGALLQALETDLFVEDIGMKRIEVARLMNFSKEGRLPVQN